MPKTANGLPYPDPTAPVREGAANIQALAKALDDRGHGWRIEARSIAVTANAAGGFGFDFAKAYQAAPIVIAASANNQAGAYLLTVGQLANGVSTTRYEGWVRNEVGGGAAYVGVFYVSYFAIGPDSTI